MASNDTEQTVPRENVEDCERRRESIKTPRFPDHKESMVLSYWMQQTQETKRQRNVMTEHELRHSDNDSLSSKIKDKRDDQLYEMKFILENFKERRCKNFASTDGFTDRLTKALRNAGEAYFSRGQHCKCGIERKFHRKSALTNLVEGEEWNKHKHTELVPPHSFGNVDVPFHVNYLETPEGTRKYVRLDDQKTKPRRVWELLRKVWRLKPPNVVISVTGGDVSDLKNNRELQLQFREGLMKTAATTGVWIITEGLHAGASKEVSDTFQENLANSEWSEKEDHANIPLIGIPPWGILANKTDLLGINLGASEAEYRIPTVEATEINPTGTIVNGLDPYHTFFLMADDGTSGQYETEPRIRRELEHYIKNKSTIRLLGSRGVKTPLVVLVLGGDRFTLNKVLDATSHNISVVVVNGSGPIANMLAECIKKVATSTNETKDIVTQDVCKKYSADGVIEQAEEEILAAILQKNHLIHVFGEEEDDTPELDKAVLQAIFSGVTEITVELSLCLAMNRPDIARDYIFKESRRNELKNEDKLIQDALYLSLKNGLVEFTTLLLDVDHGGKLDLEEFLTVKRLFKLHKKVNLTNKRTEGKVLLSLCKKDGLSDEILEDYNVLSQVGRIIHCMMGGSYRLLYQGIDFEKVDSDEFPWNPNLDNWEEAVWHLFLWAVLANKPEIAELLLAHGSCKIGGALIAYKILRGMSKAARGLAEYELAENLDKNSEHFEDVAVQTLTELYEMNRNEAYSSLVAAMPFSFGAHSTPINIADDAEAMWFMGHACCQTFLTLVWMKNMDLHTPSWKLFPVSAFFPFFVIPSMKFDPDSLTFGSYEDDPLSIPQEQRERKDSGIGSVDHDVIVDATEGLQGSDVNDDVSVTDKKGPEKKERTGLLGQLWYMWFYLMTYYTSPAVKFGLHFLSYCVLLVMFTHFLLSELRPISTIDDVTIVEWLLLAWVFGLAVEEADQLISRKSSNPIFDLDVKKFGKSWSDTWYIQERVLFFLGWHKVRSWISDRWNLLDFLMFSLFISSIILRFVLPPIDFYVVRIMYSLTLMLFYFRILRFGYIFKQLGPRIITIKAMMADLFQVILLIALFIITFGIVFQALLDPNRPASLSTVVDVIWRPYWQMYGELFLEEVNDAPGTMDNRTCTLSRTKALSDPVNLRLCHSWIVPLLLGVYMLITNILLLNLLIAIFNNSFVIIEEKSEMIWRYNLYDLVHEYYHITWLAPPLNVIVHVIKVFMWVINRCRYLCFLIAKWRLRRRMSKVSVLTSPYCVDASNPAEVKKYLDKQAEKALKKSSCGWFYFDSNQIKQEEMSHFYQPDYMRDEDVENKAYKRYLRNAKKKEHDKVNETLADQTERLQNIFTEIHDLKTATAIHRRSSVSDLDSSTGVIRQGDELQRLSGEVQAIHTRMDVMSVQMDNILRLLQNQSRMSRRWASQVSPEGSMLKNS